MNKKQKYPPGWDQKRVQEVIDYYENQTDEQRLADIEAARNAKNITMMAVPTELVPKVRALIAKDGAPHGRRSIQTKTVSK